MVRAAVGFLIAPLVPGMLLGIVSVWTVGIWWTLGIAAMAGYPVALVLGVPIYLLFQRRGVTDLFAYSLAGLAMGLVVYLAAVLPAAIFGGLDAARLPQGILGGLGRDWVYEIGVTLPIAPLSAMCGAIAAMVFWCISRPDKRGSLRDVLTGKSAVAAERANVTDANG